MQHFTLLTLKWKHFGVLLFELHLKQILVHLRIKKKKFAYQLPVVSSSYLILFEICPDSPAFVISQCVSVLLEKCVDTGDASVP